MNGLNKIRIQGFKSIVDQEFEPGQVNVLIGANGAGKTSLLEAIGILGAAISGTVDDESLQRRGVHLTTPALYNSSFKDIETHQIALSMQWQALENEIWHYAVKLENKKQNPEMAWAYIDESLKLNDKPILQRQNLTQENYGVLPQYIQGSNTYEGANAGIHFALSKTENSNGKLFSDFLRTLKSYAIYTPTTPMLRDLVTDPRSIATRVPMSLSGNRLANAVQALIDVENETYGYLDWADVQELLDWIDHIEVEAVEMISPNVPALPQSIHFIDRFMREKNNRFTVQDASEGSLYVLFLLTCAMHPYVPSLFAIENFDQALHPHLASATAELFCQAIFDNPRQPTAFLTTHNPLVLDGLDILDDRIRLFAIARNHKGHTTIRRVMVTDELLNQGKQGMSLSRLWVMGRLGGVPR